MPRLPQGATVFVHTQRNSHASNASSTKRLATRIIAVVALAAISGAFVGSISLPSQSWLLVTLNLLLASLPFLLYRTLPSQRDIFSPVYLFSISFGLLFVLRPIYDLTQHESMPRLLDLDVTRGYDRALFIGSLGAIGFYIGFYSVIGTRIANRLPLPPSVLQIESTTIYSLILAACSIILYAAFLQSTGGLSSLKAILSGRNPSSAAALSQSSGYLYSALSWLVPAALLLIITTPKWNSPRSLTAALFLFIALLPSFTTGSRSFLVPVLLSFGMIPYMKHNTRPRVLTILLLIPVALILLITVPREFRVTNARQQSLGATVLTSTQELPDTARSFLESMDTAMVSALSLEVSVVPTNLQFQYGRTYIEALARPIPRALWPNKPRAADTQLTTAIAPLRAADGLGVAFSLFGEPYLNFGIPGILPFSMVFAIGWRALFDFYRRDPYNMSVIAIYVANLPFLIVYLRGGVGVDYQRQLMTLVPLVFGLYFVGTRSNGTAQ